MVECVQFRTEILSPVRPRSAVHPRFCAAWSNPTPFMFFRFDAPRKKAGYRTGRRRYSRCRRTTYRRATTQARPDPGGARGLTCIARGCNPRPFPKHLTAAAFGHLVPVGPPAHDRRPRGCSNSGKNELVSSVLSPAGQRLRYAARVTAEGTHRFVLVAAKSWRQDVNCGGRSFLASATPLGHPPEGSRRGSRRISL